MSKAHFLTPILLTFVSFVSNCRAQLHTQSAIFIYAAPSETSPVDWANSCLMVVTHSSSNLKIQGSDPQNRTAVIGFDVKYSSLKNGPKQLTASLGVESYFPLSDIPTEAAEIEPLLPHKVDYLVIVRIPSGNKWANSPPIVPNLLIPLRPRLNLALKQGKVAGLNALFHLLALEPPDLFRQLMDWLYHEWLSEETPLYKQFPDGQPFDPSLYHLSHRYEDRAFGDGLEGQARAADPTFRFYLTLFAGMWGATSRFEPFFEACKDPAAHPDDAYKSLLVHRRFIELTFPEAFALAKKVPRPLATLMLQFAFGSTDMSQTQLVDLLSFAAQLDWKSRVEIYFRMEVGLPSEKPELKRSYPDGLAPNINVNGIIDEAGLRRKWQDYLGLSHGGKP